MALGTFNSVKNVGNLGLMFTGIGEALSAVSLAYDIALKLFSTSTKTEIVQSYTKLGFESYDNLVTIQYYLGVSASNINSLKSVIVRSLYIPKDKVKSFNDYIDFADVVDSSSWTNYNSFLKSDNSGGAKSVQVFFNIDSKTNKYNVFVTETKTQFKVADDIYVMKKTKSTFGGAFVKEDFSIKRQSHTVTPEDAETLMTFFDIIAFKKFKTTLEAFKPFGETA